MRLGKVVAERFTIERLAGEGGMGAVYRGRDKRTDETVAIKVLHHPGTHDAERFAREAEVLAQLAHPALVRYIDHGEESGVGPYLVMEWLDGETLDARLERQDLNLTETLALGMRAAEALAVAHAAGVVHRDIKPSNLFLPEGDAAQAKLIDFGVARRFGFEAANLSLTRPGAVIGTPGFMAPEQARGEHRLEPSADIFALGCVLYRCLTGRVPFAGDNALAVLAKILLEEAPRPISLCPNLHPLVDDLLVQMLCKDRSRRLADARKVVSTLAQIPDSGDVLGTTLQGLKSPFAKPSRPKRESLTEAEQRLLCVVLGAEGPQAKHTEAGQALDVEELRVTAEKAGARLERLADGSMVAVVAGAGAPTDLATRAARCALALSPLASQLDWAIATGRAVLEGSMPVGEAIDRAVKLLAGTGSAPAGEGILIDDVTAALLAGRFAIRPGKGDSGPRLVGTLESAASHVVRPQKVAGKAIPFVGRAAELRRIQALMLDTIADSVAQGVVMTGPPGIGKTRLAREVLARLAKKLSREVAEPTILVGSADELGAGSAYRPLIDALRRTAELSDDQPLEVRRDKVQRRFGRGAVKKGAVQFIGELLGVPGGDDEEVRALRSKPALLGDAVRTALLGWMHRECQERPLVLLLDDLHWGDRPTVDFLRTAMRELARRPLFVLCIGRPELRQRYPDLVSDHLEALELGPLDRHSGSELVQLALGDGADEETVEALTDRGAGNPFFLEELIRAQIEGRLSSLPASILGTVEGLVASLDAPDKLVLRAASIFGTTFWRSGVVALVGGPERADMVDDALKSVTSGGLIVPSSKASLTGEDEHAFRQGLVREAAYAMLTDEDRTLGHRLAGEWLENHPGVSPMALAEHFARGGEPMRAAEAYLRAAEQALDANDFDAVLERIQLALSHGASGQQLGRARRLEAGALNWLGRHGEAHEAAWAALNSVPSGSAAWFGSIEELLIALSQRADPATFELVERARNAEPAPEAVRAKLSCLARSAVALAQGGRIAVATAVVEEVGRLAVGAEALGPLDRGRLHLAQALIARSQMDLDACLAEHALAYQQCKQAHDIRTACLARLSHGSVLLETGRVEDALPLLTGARRAAERLGADGLLAHAEMALAEAAYRRIDHEQARQLAGQAADRTRGHQELSLEGRANVLLSRIALDEGNAALAERQAQTAARRLVGMGPLRAIALAIQARAMVALARHTAALALLEEALSLCDESDALGIAEALVRLVQIEALEASGDVNGARTASNKAVARLLERSTRLTSVEWQSRFLETVPENARIVAFANKYGRLGSEDDEITLR